MEYDLIKRLSQYKKILVKLKTMGFVKVFSDNLSDALGISASLVRKDFAACNLTGKRRGGYQVNELIEKLNILLGKNSEQRVIMVGCGKLGSALMNYRGFDTEQIKIVAGFDTNPQRQNPDANPCLSCRPTGSVYPRTAHTGSHSGRAGGSLTTDDGAP